MGLGLRFRVLDFRCDVRFSVSLGDLAFRLKRLLRSVAQASTQSIPVEALCSRRFTMLTKRPAKIQDATASMFVGTVPTEDRKLRQ